MRPQRPPSWPASWHSHARPNVADEPVHAVLSLGHCAAQAMARMGAPTAKSANIPGHPWARNKQGPLPPETPAAATGRIPHCAAQGPLYVAPLPRLPRLLSSTRCADCLPCSPQLLLILPRRIVAFLFRLLVLFVPPPPLLSAASPCCCAAAVPQRSCCFASEPEPISCMHARGQL